LGDPDEFLQNLPLRDYQNALASGPVTSKKAEFNVKRATIPCQNKY